MKRRDFLVGVGASAAASTLPAPVAVAEPLVAERHVQAAGAGTYSNRLGPGAVSPIRLEELVTLVVAFNDHGWWES